MVYSFLEFGTVLPESLDGTGIDVVFHRSRGMIGREILS